MVLAGPPNAGKSTLLHAHLKEVAGYRGAREGTFMARRRHLDALQRGLGCVEQAGAALANGLGEELVVEDLRQAQRALGEITGEVTSEELLGRIFTGFCVGK